MPIYAYSCKNCNHNLDALQKMADAPLVDCPSCGEPQLKRQLSAPRFRLKGQGWYETDFKKDNQRNIAGDKDTSKSDDSKSDSSKSDSKQSKSKQSDSKKSDSKTDTTSSAVPKSSAK